MTPSKCKFLILISALLAGSGAYSQDFSLNPIYGSVSLSGGFTPDPHVIALAAGGNLLASNAKSDCSGYVSDNPSFSLTHEPGSLGLGIYINAEFDTTILINTPSGDWVCNDDNDNLDNLNSGYYFASPESGRYDIWVGSYSESDVNRSAILAISEYEQSSWETDLSASVNTPELSLSGGFTPDPYTLNVSAGGPNQAANLDSACSGYVSPSPSYRLNFSPGSLGLGIYTIAEFDTTIAIQAPDGRWYCNDDNDNLDNLNSGYYFSSPSAGNYNIYVGSYSEDFVGNSASLAISEYSESSWNPNSEPVIPEVPEVPDGVIQTGSKLL
tara:strand:- start:4187 stop:5167 length:981 start_codon:yes stop_codon:yes gene_type:complete